MSNLSFNQNGRLSDSLERDLMRQALSDGESISITALAQKAMSLIAQGAETLSFYISDVTKALNEARAKDVHFSGSQW